MERMTKKIRWWPLGLVWIMGVVAASFFIATSGGEDEVRQVLVMKLIGVIGSCVTLSFLWLFGFSRLRSRVKLWWLGAIGVLAIFLVSTVRYEGVSGDLVPLFAWKWGRAAVLESDAELPLQLVVDGSFPQFLGPDRNATLPGIDLSKDWLGNPPELLWRKPVGEAWSGFAISGRRAITQEQEGGDERTVCYDLLSGEELWESRSNARYDNPLGGVGPRATVAIEGGRVYALGATGEFSCLDIESGERLWGFNLLESHSAPLPDWGVAGSPLIHGNLVILSAGGKDGNSLVAYDTGTGDLVWAGGSDKAHWSSPVAYEIDGVVQILIFNRGGVAAHDPTNGNVLWEFPWTQSTGTPRVAIPVQLPGDHFVVSSGYGAGAALFQVAREDSGFVANQDWKSLHLKSKFNNFVFRDGYLYGLDDGMMTCIDAATGRRAWKKGRYGHGQLLLGDDWLLLMAENGEVILMEPVPEEPRILGSFQALEGKSWNPPAMVGPYLLVRNHREAACYRLALAE